MRIAFTTFKELKKLGKHYKSLRQKEDVVFTRIHIQNISVEAHLKRSVC